MRETLEILCGDFIKNRDCIKSVFGWESTYIYPVCASIFTEKRMQADRERLEYCRDILREHTGVFSNFRGYAKLPMISMLAVDEAPQRKLENALKAYACLKEHFFSSSYLPVAAMIIADIAEECHYDGIAARTRAIYELMKSNHPFLTSGEDSVFAAMLALSPLTDERVVQETEACYEILNSEFFSSNAVQSLSHVLALAQGSAEEKCGRTMELFNILRERGRKYGTSYELASLGVLALLKEDTESLAVDILEADDFLAEQKGYGLLGPGRKQRLMHAGMLVSSDFIDAQGNLAMTSATIGGTISLIAAQQAAMCAAIAASAAASANSSSSN